MKKLALIIFVFGVLILSLLFELPFREIRNFEDLSELEVNRKVILRGEVSGERIISNGRRILIVNGIENVCECDGNFAGRKVEVEGIVSEYEGNKQVEVLKIRR